MGQGIYHGLSYGSRQKRDGTSLTDHHNMIVDDSGQSHKIIIIMGNVGSSTPRSLPAQRLPSRLSSRRLAWTSPGEASTSFRAQAMAA